MSHCRGATPHGTRRGEYARTAEMLPEILETQGLYFVLMLLVDSGYQREDVRAVAERIGPDSKIGRRDG